jgi:hypothetical protein
VHTKEEYLNIVIPYRMKAIDVFRVALTYELSWNAPKKLKIYFDEKLSVEGLSTAWTNPVIESGIMHCRACLEFLGLKEDPKKSLKLKTRNGKRDDDFGIEDWGLSCLSVEDAVEPYAGPKEEAEKALACVIHCANKGIAHATSGLIVVDEDRKLYEIAARGIPTLIINYQVPCYSIPMRSYPLFRAREWLKALMED